LTGPNKKKNWKAIVAPKQGGQNSKNFFEGKKKKYKQKNVGGGPHGFNQIDRCPSFFTIPLRECCVWREERRKFVFSCKSKKGPLLLGPKNKKKKLFPFKKLGWGGWGKKLSKVAGVGAPFQS